MAKRFGGDKEDGVEREAINCFVCPRCKAEFYSVTRLSKHLEEDSCYYRSSTSDSYHCPIENCTQKCVRRDGIRRHIQRAHSGEAQSRDHSGQQSADESGGSHTNPPLSAIKILRSGKMVGQIATPIGEASTSASRRTPMVNVDRSPITRYPCEARDCRHISFSADEA